MANDNSYNKTYLDGDALLEGDLDAGFLSVQPSISNLAASTTGSSSGDILASTGSNAVPNYISPGAFAATIPASAATSLFNTVISVSQTVANLVGVAMGASGANAIIATANSQSVPTAVLANNILGVVSSCQATVADLIIAACSTTATYSGTLLGKADASDAAVGVVGEYSVSKSGTLSQNISVSGTWENVRTLDLTAGDWDVSGNICIAHNSSTALVNIQGVISLFSGNTTTDHLEGDNKFISVPPAAAQSANAAIPPYRVNISDTATVYLKATATFSAGNPQVIGARISARRVR